ncbi:MAG: hypothetical protein ACR2IQ_01975 [Minisyncoccia bacterium]
MSEYPVTVLSQDITSFSGKFNKAMAGEYPYLAVTESGDTVQVLVDEELLLKNKRPFKAVMTKDSNSRFGMVHAN